MRTIAALLSPILWTSLVLAAPLKDQEKPLPAPTEEQYATSINNLKHLGLGVHNYHDVNSKMPSNRFLEKKPALSWRVHLLPYLEEEALYREFKLNEPWDSEHNKKLIAKIPKVYQPVRGRFKKGETFYQMFNGEQCILRPDGSATALQGITDGTSNTFLIVEAYKPVVWTQPDDILYKSDSETAPKLGGMFDGYFNAVMGDGAVYRMPKNINDETLRRLIEPNDGKLVDLRKVIDEAKQK
jgi:hypothetical protein